MGVVLPGWADEILDIIGISWPNVDEDDYREMADSMREFADDIDSGAMEAHQAVQGLVGSAGGSVAVEALNAHWGKINGTHLKNLGQCGRLAGTALDGVAVLIEGAKIGAIAQLAILAAEVIAAQAAAPFTFGLSELGALAGTQATRVAVRKIFKEVCEQVAERVISIALTPVEEALGAMVGDLVVQLGANALGVKDGVDLGQTAKAGKEGLSQGAQGAKDSSMQLLSAGGGSGGGGGAGSGFSFDPDEHDRAVTGLQSAGGTFRNKAGGKIGRAKSHHGRTRGKDAIADAANAMLDKVIDGIEDGVKKTAKHLDDNMTRGIKQMAKNHHENDRAISDHFAGLGKGGGKDPKSPRTSPNSTGKGPGGSGNSKPRDQLNQNHPHNNTRDDKAVQGCGDPVDAATGRVYLRQTDLELPGALPLTFVRKFESSYRSGRSVGPSWSSTADQRLEIDRHGIIFVTEAGLLLSYPTPETGERVLPARGPRWPLMRTVQGDWAIHDPDTGHTRYFSQASHAAGIALLDEINDRQGNRITFDHDDRTGAPVEIRHSAGYHLKFTTDDRGLITALHLAGAADDGSGSDALVMSYDHDEHGNLTSVTNSSGTPTRFEYDGTHQMTAWVDTNNSRYEYTYDHRGRCTAQGGTEGHLRYRYDYDRTDPQTGHRITAVTNSLGHTTRFLINDRLQVAATVDPLGHTTRTTYDDFDRPLTHTDALGHTTRYTYDDQGRPLTVTRPDGLCTTVEYNDLGLPRTVTSPDGTTRLQEYDATGNRTALIDPAGSVTRYTYDQRGHLSSVTDPLGATTQVTCNDAGLLTSVIDPVGATTHYQHDAHGRVTAFTDPAGAVIRLAWTAEGHLARRTDPDGSHESWTYDGEGNCVTHTDAIGARTSFEYTHFDQLAARTGPDGVRYTFTHNTELQLTQVENPLGAAWTYHYDPAGRLSEETDFDGRTVTYAHDAAGQLIQRTNAMGQHISYTRDTNGDIIHKDVDGSPTDYSYDALGRLIHATSPHAELRLQRDALGRITAETLNGRTVRHTYDAAGQRTRRTTPAAVVSHYTYDPAGRPQALTTCGHTIAFTHDAVGREKRRTFGQWLALDHDWDAQGRLTRQTASAGNNQHPVQQRSYTYNAAGSLLGIDDLLTGTRRFTLDPAGRVTHVQGHNWREEYAYDGLGNQTEARWPGQHPNAEGQGSRAYTGTRITRAGRIRYEHDAQGRMTLRQKTRLSRKPDTWRYAWDAENRLTTVITPDNTTWTYLYDPLGRRIAKQTRQPTGEPARTDFTWDGTTLIEETTTSPTSEDVTLTWEYDDIRPMTQAEQKTSRTGNTSAQAERKTGEAPQGEAPQEDIDRRFFAIVTDLTGTPAELIDEHGTPAWRARSTLWGTTAWTHTSTAYTPHRFPGQYFDAESQLHYNVYRYYDPESARYASPDPLGLEPAPNPVTYVHNPHTWADPLGLAPCTHYADVYVYRPDGSLRTGYGLRSGNQTPEERALGFPNGSLASHTENRVGRMSGGSPTRPIANDPYANLVPVSPGETVVINGTRPPCPQCRGSMNRAQAETGANFIYRWGDGNEWRAGRRGR
ncbi:DUF6531 domain-containing protein [Streptomyces sp. NPDC001339]|uniref:DUF6531 domain-containing protein n=1 Tax=Streptomyces sp. NPDC001339 TaxID=3364563 RepID=UPI0036CC2C35